MSNNNVYVGIDVSKARLDVHLLPAGDAFFVPNDAKGIADLIAQLQDVNPCGIVLEATGGIEMPPAIALVAAKLAPAVLNPSQVRGFAHALGRQAKTDAIDAKILARYAEAMKPIPRPLPDAEARQLDALITRRRRLVEIRVAEKNRLGLVTSNDVRRDLEAHITYLSDRIEELDEALNKMVEASEVCKPKADLLRTVPGVGPVLAHTLLAGDDARAGDLDEPAGVRAGGTGAGRPRRRHNARTTLHPRGAERLACGLVYGCGFRRACESCSQGVLRPPRRCG